MAWYTNLLPWSFAGYTLLFTFVILYYMMFASRVTGFFISLLLRWKFGNNLEIKVGSADLALLGGQLFIHDLVCNTKNICLSVLRAKISVNYWSTHVRTTIEETNLPFRLTIQLIGLNLLIHSNMPKIENLASVIQEQINNNLPSVSKKTTMNSIIDIQFDEKEEKSEKESLDQYNFTSTYQKDTPHLSISTSQKEDDINVNVDELLDEISEITDFTQHLDWYFRIIPQSLILLSDTAIMIGNYELPYYTVLSAAFCEAITYYSQPSETCDLYKVNFSLISQNLRVNIKPTVIESLIPNEGDRDHSAKRTQQDFINSALRAFKNIFTDDFNLRSPQPNLFHHDKDSYDNKVSSLPHLNVNIDMYKPFIRCNKIRFLYYYDVPCQFNYSIIHIPPPKQGIIIENLDSQNQISYGPFEDYCRKMIQEFFLPFFYRNQPLVEYDISLPRPFHFFNIEFLCQKSLNIRIPYIYQDLLTGESYQHYWSIKIGKDSNINYNSPWYALNQAGSTGYIVSCLRNFALYHFTDVINRFSPLSSQPFLLSRSLSLEFFLQYPIRWNDLYDWSLSFTFTSPIMYLLRDHINLFTSLASSWGIYSSVNPVSLNQFIPCKYSLNLSLLKKPSIFFNVNEFNIIDDHTLHIEKNGQITSKNNLIQLSSSAIEISVQLGYLEYLSSNSEYLCKVEIPHSGFLSLYFPYNHPFNNIITEQNNYILLFQSFSINLSFLSHYHVNPEYIDSLNLNIRLTEADLHLYGHIIRFLLNFQQNYSGDLSSYISSIDYKKHGYTNDIYRNLNNIYYFSHQDFNNFESASLISVLGLTIRLPSHIYDLSHPITLRTSECYIESRNLDQYSDLIMTMTPLILTVDDHKPEFNDFYPLSYLEIYDFCVQIHSSYGLHPQSYCYKTKNRFYIQHIQGSLMPSQYNILFNTFQNFMIQYNESIDYNNLSFCNNLENRFIPDAEILYELADQNFEVCVGFIDINAFLNNCIAKLSCNDGLLYTSSSQITNLAHSTSLVEINSFNLILLYSFQPLKLEDLISKYTLSKIMEIKGSAYITLAQQRSDWKAARIRQNEFIYSQICHISEEPDEIDHAFSSSVWHQRNSDRISLSEDVPNIHYLSLLATLPTPYNTRWNSTCVFINFNNQINNLSLSEYYSKNNISPILPDIFQKLSISDDRYLSPILPDIFQKSSISNSQYEFESSLDNSLIDKDSSTTTSRIIDVDEESFHSVYSDHNTSDLHQGMYYLPSISSSLSHFLLHSYSMKLLYSNYSANPHLIDQNRTPSPVKNKTNQGLNIQYQKYNGWISSNYHKYLKDNIFINEFKEKKVSSNESFETNKYFTNKLHLLLPEFNVLLTPFFFNIINELTLFYIPRYSTIEDIIDIMHPFLSQSVFQNQVQLVCQDQISVCIPDFSLSLFQNHLNSQEKEALSVPYETFINISSISFHQLISYYPHELLLNTFINSPQSIYRHFTFNYFNIITKILYDDLPSDFPSLPPCRIRYQTETENQFVLFNVHLDQFSIETTHNLSKSSLFYIDSEHENTNTSISISFSLQTYNLLSTFTLPCILSLYYYWIDKINIAFQSIQVISHTSTCRIQSILREGLLYGIQSQNLQNISSKTFSTSQFFHYYKIEMNFLKWCYFHLKQNNRKEIQSIEDLFQFIFTEHLDYYKKYLDISDEQLKNSEPSVLQRLWSMNDNYSLSHVLPFINLIRSLVLHLPTMQMRRKLNRIFPLDYNEDLKFSLESNELMQRPNNISYNINKELELYYYISQTSLSVFQHLICCNLFPHYQSQLSLQDIQGSINSIDISILSSHHPLIHDFDHQILLDHINLSISQTQLSYPSFFLIFMDIDKILITYNPDIYNIFQIMDHLMIEYNDNFLTKDLLNEDEDAKNPQQYLYNIIEEKEDIYEGKNNELKIEDNQLNLYHFEGNLNDLRIHLDLCSEQKYEKIGFFEININRVSLFCDSFSISLDNQVVNDSYLLYFSSCQSNMGVYSSFIHPNVKEKDKNIEMIFHAAIEKIYIPFYFSNEKYENCQRKRFLILLSSSNNTFEIFSFFFSGQVDMSSLLQTWFEPLKEINIQSYLNFNTKPTKNNNNQFDLIKGVNRYSITFHFENNTFKILPQKGVFFTYFLDHLGGKIDQPITHHTTMNLTFGLVTHQLKYEANLREIAQSKGYSSLVVFTHPLSRLRLFIHYNTKNDHDNTITHQGNITIAVSHMSNSFTADFLFQLIRFMIPIATNINQFIHKFSEILENLEKKKENNDITQYSQISHSFSMLNQNDEKERNTTSAFNRQWRNYNILKPKEREKKKNEDIPLHIIVNFLFDGFELKVSTTPTPHFVQSSLHLSFFRCCLEYQSNLDVINNQLILNTRDKDQIERDRNGRDIDILSKLEKKIALMMELDGMQFSMHSDPSFPGIKADISLRLEFIAKGTSLPHFQFPVLSISFDIFKTHFSLQPIALKQYQYFIDHYYSAYNEFRKQTNEFLDEVVDLNMAEHAVVMFNKLRQIKQEESRNNFLVFLQNLLSISFFLRFYQISLDLLCDPNYSEYESSSLHDIGRDDDSDINDNNQMPTRSTLYFENKAFSLACSYHNIDIIDYNDLNIIFKLSSLGVYLLPSLNLNLLKNPELSNCILLPWIISEGHLKFSSENRIIYLKNEFDGLQFYMNADFANYFHNLTYMFYEHPSNLHFSSQSDPIDISSRISMNSDHSSHRPLHIEKSIEEKFNNYLSNQQYNDCLNWIKTLDDKNYNELKNLYDSLSSSFIFYQYEILLIMNSGNIFLQYDIHEQQTIPLPQIFGHIAGNISPEYSPSTFSITSIINCSLLFHILFIEKNVFLHEHFLIFFSKILNDIPQSNSINYTTDQDVAPSNYILHIYFVPPTISIISEFYSFEIFFSHYLNYFNSCMKDIKDKDKSSWIVTHSFVAPQFTLKVNDNTESGLYIILFKIFQFSFNLGYSLPSTTSKNPPQCYHIDLRSFDLSLYSFEHLYNLFDYLDHLLLLSSTTSSSSSISCSSIYSLRVQQNLDITIDLNIEPIITRTLKINFKKLNLSVIQYDSPFFKTCISIPLISVKYPLSSVIINKNESDLDNIDLDFKIENVKFIYQIAEENNNNIFPLFYLFFTPSLKLDVNQNTICILKAQGSPRMEQYRGGFTVFFLDSSQHSALLIDLGSNLWISIETSGLLWLSTFLSKLNGLKEPSDTTALQIYEDELDITLPELPERYNCIKYISISGLRWEINLFSEYRNKGITLEIVHHFLSLTSSDNIYGGVNRLLILNVGNLKESPISSKDYIQNQHISKNIEYTSSYSYERLKSGVLINVNEEKLALIEDGFNMRITYTDQQNTLNEIVIDSNWDQLKLSTNMSLYRDINVFYNQLISIIHNLLQSPDSDEQTSPNPLLYNFSVFNFQPPINDINTVFHWLGIDTKLQESVISFSHQFLTLSLENILDKISRNLSKLQK